MDKNEPAESRPGSQAHPAALDARRAAMGVMARATREELAAALAHFGAPQAVDVRPVEIGLVMLRGRIGGDGAPFNVGEATVTRAAVRLGDSGAIGHGYVLGRDPAKARYAAMLDALREAGEAERVDGEALAPIKSRIAADATRAAEETAATRVDFFTLVRGED